MNTSAPLLTDLTLGLSAAWFAGFVALRLRLNPILGYLIAGILIGPFAPGQIAHAQNVEGLATLGLIFLLFSLGLDFSFEELRSSGAKGIWVNGFTTAVGAAAAWACFRLIHLQHPITAALTTAVSSTAVGVALLKDWKHEGEGASRFAITQQVVQDVFAIALLVICTAPLEVFSFRDLAWPLLQAIIFVALSIVIGHTLLKEIVHKILRNSSTERLFIAFAALSMVAASLSKLVGLSYEFGAFVAGAVISAATGTKMVGPIVAPFRAIFVALFFVSIGMLFRLTVLVTYLVPILWIGGGLIVARFGLWNIVARRRKFDRKLGALGALAMTALGEFNCVLINEAAAANRLSANEQQFLLGIVLFSIISVMLLAPHMPHLLQRHQRPLAPEGVIQTVSPVVAIIGFGRVGAAVGHVLRDAGVPFTALEYQRSLIETARENGFDIIFGEPLDPVALDRVILPSTRIVVTTVAEAPVNMAVAEHVAHRYDVEIIARAGHGTDISELIEQRGATLAYVPETEGALVFARAILESLEYHPDEIERCVEEERRSSRGLSVAMEDDHHHLFTSADEQNELARET